MYILKTFDKTQFEISDEEAVKIAAVMNDGTAKTVAIRGNVIAVSAISGLLKDEVARESEGNDHKLGILHDGTRVIRQFGEWMCMDSNFDEAGRYSTRPDPRYYPEVAVDTVPSVEDYHRRFKHLALEERKALMLEGRDLDRYTRQGGLSKIDATLPQAAIGATQPEPEYCERHQTFIVDCSCSEQRAEDARESESEV